MKREYRPLRAGGQNLPGSWRYPRLAGSGTGKFNRICDASGYSDTEYSRAGLQLSNLVISAPLY